MNTEEHTIVMNFKGAEVEPYPIQFSGNNFNTTASIQSDASVKFKNQNANASSSMSKEEYLQSLVDSYKQEIENFEDDYNEIGEFNAEFREEALANKKKRLVELEKELHMIRWEGM